MRVIELIHSPVAKLLMSTKLINKLDKHVVQINPQSVYNIVMTENWLAEKQENDLTQTLNPADENVNSSQYYPCLQHQQRFAISGLSDQKFIDLLRMAFEAYVNVQHIKEVAEGLKHKNSTGDGDSLKKQFEGNVGQHGQKTQAEMDFDMMAEGLDKLSEIQMNSAADDHPIYPNHIVNKKLMPMLLETYYAVQRGHQILRNGSEGGQPGQERLLQQLVSD